MAILIAGPGGIDFETLAIFDLTLADVVTASASAITMQDGDWMEYFTGAFTYTNDELSGGTVNSWRETYQGVTRFEVSDFAVAVTDFITWATNNDNEAARSTILAGADQITGSAAADRMYGYVGNDTITGGAGQDYLRGNEGDDVITGGADFDDVHGNMGNDTVSGGLGEDWVVGGKDNDLLNGDEDFDVVYGNLGNDTLNGGTGNDWVRGGQNEDVIDAGAGDDWISGDKGADTITGGDGADLFNFFAGAGSDRILDFDRAEGDFIRWEGAAVAYTLTSDGADTVIDFGNGDVIRLVGTTLDPADTGWIVTTG